MKKSFFSAKNIVMLFLGFELSYYKQLALLNRELILGLDNKLDTIIKQISLKLLKSKNGFYLFSFGDEKKIDPADVLEISFNILNIFKEKNSELFGFQALLLTDSLANPGELENIFKNYLLLIEGQEGLWILRKDFDLFGNYALTKEENEFYQIIESKKIIPTYNALLYISSIRERLIKKLAQQILQWFVKAKSKVLVIYGQKDLAKLETTLQALNKIVGERRNPFIQIIETKPEQFSPFGPIAESILATKEFVLKKISHYLTSWEKEVWKAYFHLFKLILENKTPATNYLKPDFFQSYQLYFLAYCRLMQSLNLPAILIIYEPWRLSAFGQDIFQKIITDLSQKFQINIIAISSRKKQPLFLNELGLSYLLLKPLGLREINNCFKVLYPALRVPKAVLKTILRLSAGKLTAVLHYIYYLRLNKKIIQEEKGFAWVPAQELKIKIPTRPLLATASIIKSLKEEVRTILAAYYFVHKLFSDKEKIDFINFIGLAPRKAEEQIIYLKNLRLLKTNLDKDQLKALRSILNKQNSAKIKYIKEQLAVFLQEHLADFLPARAVKLYPLLAACKIESLILKTLPEVLDFYFDTNRHKLKLKSFLKKLPVLKSPIFKPEEKLKLDYLLFTAKLHCALKNRDLVKASGLLQTTRLALESLEPDTLFAALYLEIGRFYFASCELAKASTYFKKAMHYYQELNDSFKTGESFFELGRFFLAKGNCKEALDYFSFSGKMLKESNKPRLKAILLWNKASAYFLHGNYSQIKNCCAEAALITSSFGLKDLEILFNFIKARVMFDFGFYEKAIHFYEEALSLAELKDFKQFKATLLAWLARTFAYLGNYKLALTILRSLPENEENQFFLGETYFLMRDEKKAEKAFVKALNLPSLAVYSYYEHQSWQTGFDLLEGLCPALNESALPLKRLAKAFRAYLLCQGKDLAEGVAQLHNLTITEKILAFDPYAHLFYFLYYLVLKTIDKNRTDLPEIGHALTILNKSLKHLQERSANIDEPRDRVNYITQNYWSKHIMEEAKANKLI